MTELVRVEERDRERFAAYWAEKYGTATPEYSQIFEGEMDGHPIAQMLAAHRLAALSHRTDAGGEDWCCDRIHYSGDAIDAVQRLLEQGKATVNSDGYLQLVPLSPPPDRGAALREAAQAVLDNRSSTYTARNGRQVGVQGDDGEKVWLVHSDFITELEGALSRGKDSSHDR